LEQWPRGKSSKSYFQCETDKIIKAEKTENEFHKKENDARLPNLNTASRLTFESRLSGEEQSDPVGRSLLKRRQERGACDDAAGLSSNMSLLAGYQIRNLSIFRRND